jgi:hypothetical protein
MMTCRKCGSELPLSGAICPFCWTERPEGEPLFGCLFVLFVAGLIYFLGCHHRQEKAERHEPIRQVARAGELQGGLGDSPARRSGTP